MLIGIIKLLTGVKSNIVNSEKKYGLLLLFLELLL